MKQTTKPLTRTGRRRPGKGSLFLIASFLIGSAVLRVGVGAGQAMAREEPFQLSMSQGGASEQSCAPTEDYRRLMDAFDAREDRIKLQESEIRNRLQALSVADIEVSRKLAALEGAETRLRETIALAETAAEDDLSRLTTVYETMKPKEAAILFEEMAPEFAAGFVGRMTPQAAAGVLAGMTPKGAYAISVILAGRNVGVPTE